MALAANPAAAVHDDNLFELDGNAVNETKPAPFDGDDWDVVYSNRADECATLAATANEIVACSFAADAPGGSIFTTGGSKDQQEVQTSWRHTNGAVPDKDDLLDAFAAQYEDGQLYFGADRFATNGDAQIGFWFFHDEISLNANGTFSGFHTAHAANGPGEADDTNGDILILSNFSNGGTVPTIRVFEWYGVNDVRELPGVTSALCAPTLVDDKACAITSSGGQTSPWPFTPKSGAANVFGNGAFYEGGIDLAALGFGGDCFSSFLAETRSSTSITATLKDFVLGELGDCGVSVTTQVGQSEYSIGTGSVMVSDTATIAGTGSVSAPDPTGTVDFYLCGPSAGIASCDVTGALVAENVALDGVSNPSVVSSGDVPVTAAGDYCFFADYSGDGNYDPAGDNGENECFTVTPVTPEITTNAQAGPVDPGTPLKDTATLTGTANQPDGSPAGGTITFNVYGPDDATCAGPAVFTSTVDVSGDGVYDSDADGEVFAPTDPGVYRWIAAYSGNEPNTNPDAGACNDANESSTVNQTEPTVESAQRWLPNDVATIDSDGGGPLDGTAHFALYASADCGEAGGDAAVYTEPPIAVLPAAGANQVIPTTNTTYIATSTGTTEYSWLFSYTSNDDGQKDIAPTCVEVTTLTIDNDNSD